MLRGLAKKRLGSSWLVCTACVLLFVGIGLARVWRLGTGWWLLGLLPALALSWRRRGLWALLVVAVLAGGFGWWRGSAMIRALQPYSLLAKQPVVIQGQATADSSYDKRHQTTFPLGQVQVLSPFKASLPGVLGIAGFGSPPIYRGDTVQVSGKLYPPFGGQQGSISFGQLTLLTRNTSSLDTLRHHFAAGLESALPEPQASFGLGLLIGQRNTLPDEVTHTMLAVGLTHIIAVSGYNLTIIVDVVRRVLAKRSKFQTAAGCVLLILLFLTITGSSPSIVRAAIISMLSIAAWYYGREIKPLVLLLTAGVVTAVANPLYIWGNIGWYLSFLAFFGVVVVAPQVIRRMYGDRQPRLLMLITIETLCAEVMTLPYVLYIFGQLSLVSLPANLLVVALVPLAMLLCLVAGLAGMWLPLGAGWLAWPAKELLTYMLDISSLLSRVPHSFVQHIDFNLAMLLTTYGLVLGVVFILRHKNAIITDKIDGAGGFERSF